MSAQMNPDNDKSQSKPVQDGRNEHGDFVGFQIGGDRPLPMDVGQSPSEIVSRYPAWNFWDPVYRNGAIEIGANDPSLFTVDMVEDIEITANGGSVMLEDNSNIKWMVEEHSRVDDPVLDIFTYTRMSHTQIPGLEVVHKHYY